MRAALVVLCCAPALAWAQGSPVTLTNTLVLEAHGDNGNADPSDDDYQVLIDRLNLQASMSELVLSLRLDAVGFLNVPPGARYESDVRPERVSLRYNAGSFELTAGDFQRQLGRGILLSIRKVDEVGLDLSLRGADVRWTPEGHAFGVFAGVLNPSNLDAVSLDPLDDPGDLVAGLSYELGAIDQLVIGAHGLYLQPSDRLLDTLDYTVSGGGYVELHELLPGLSLYGEGDVQSRRLAGTDELGYAAYVTADASFGDLAILLEGLWLADFQQKGSQNGALLSSFDLNQVPTLERIDQEVLNNRDVRGQWDIILNEITDTTSDVFLGVGLQCARCHDHKFDPVLQKDYFRLRAFFEAIDPQDKVVVAPTAEQQTFESQLQEWETQTAELRAQIAELEAPYRSRAAIDAIGIFPLDIQHIMNALPESRSPLEQQIHNLAWRQVDYEYDRLDEKIKGDRKDRLLELRRELAKHDDARPASLPTALVVTDISSHAPPTTIPKRLTEVGPGFLSIMDSADAAIAPPAPNQKTTGRRTALAKWLTQPDNPLSTRVIVNRIWQGHFGRGLAQNASDFGTLGGPPSHPELLDWLTARFVNNGWQMKDLHRLIVTSATYRQSSEHPQLAAFQLIDPANRFYWRFNTRRLDAEQIRDAILAVTGQLDLAAGGPGVQSDVPRRSIYLRVMRNERDALLDVFDLPLFFTSTSSRDTTTSPVQSLLLFNSQIMMNHGLKFADHLQSLSGETHETLQTLWKSALGRLPTDAEVADAREFIAGQTERIFTERKSIELAAVPIGRVPYRDGQAVIIDPDETPLRLSADSTALQHGATFTIEACLQIRSVYETGAVRTIAAKWDGQKQSHGWSFGVTGKTSRRKPQTLVLQLFGEGDGEGIREAALFSDQQVELNTPYFAAVSVTSAASGPDSGTATFYLKNLSNDDEPMQVATITHSISSDISNSVPLSLGFRTGSDDSFFDGLLDDIRLSSSALPVEQLLLTSEKSGPETQAFWRFEPLPGIFEDSSDHAIRLSARLGNSTPSTPAHAALADLCHVILNSNEFLYVR